MKDDTGHKMYEEAKEKLQALLRQESAIREQIVKWAPVVENLARLCGEHLEPELAARLTQELQPGLDMGLTEAIRWIFSQQDPLSALTPTQVRDCMGEMGYDLSKYAFVMPPIHNTLKRMTAAGELDEVESTGRRAYRRAKSKSPSKMK